MISIYLLPDICDKCMSYSLVRLATCLSLLIFST